MRADYHDKKRKENSLSLLTILLSEDNPLFTYEAMGESKLNELSSKTTELGILLINQGSAGNF